jgi:hypothetical protein
MSIASCAGTYTLSDNTKILRDRMTTNTAAATLQKYMSPDDTRIGACILHSGGAETLTDMDSSQPVVVSGSEIVFFGYNKEVTDLKVSGNVIQGTGVLTKTFKRVRQRYAFNTTGLNRILILKAGEMRRSACLDAKPGYLIALRPESGGLPYKAELSLNVASTADLETVLAALSHLAPQAQILAAGL